MEESVKKKVDESWKEQADREKRVAPKGAGEPAGPPQPRDEGLSGPEGLPQARFDLFISGLAMEALVALGDMPHPATRKQSVQLPHARYLIDLLGILEQKTAGNLTADEDRLFKDTLYQLRMRYLSKSGGA